MDSDNGFRKGEITFITCNKNNGVNIISLNDAITQKNRFLLNNNVPFDSSIAPENNFILISCEEEQFSYEECLQFTNKIKMFVNNKELGIESFTHHGFYSTSTIADKDMVIILGARISAEPLVKKILELSEMEIFTSSINARLTLSNISETTKNNIASAIKRHLLKDVKVLNLVFKTDRSVYKPIAKSQNFGSEVFVDISYKKKPIDSNFVEYTNIFGLKKFAVLKFNYVFTKKSMNSEKAKNIPPKSVNEEVIVGIIKKLFHKTKSCKINKCTKSTCTFYHNEQQCVKFEDNAINCSQGDMDTLKLVFPGLSLGNIKMLKNKFRSFIFNNKVQPFVNDATSSVNGDSPNSVNGDSPKCSDTSKFNDPPLTDDFEDVVTRNTDNTDYVMDSVLSTKKTYESELPILEVKALNSQLSTSILIETTCVVNNNDDNNNISVNCDLLSKNDESKFPILEVHALNSSFKGTSNYNVLPMIDDLDDVVTHNNDNAVDSFSSIKNYVSEFPILEVKGLSGQMYTSLSVETTCVANNFDNNNNLSVNCDSFSKNEELSDTLNYSDMYVTSSVNCEVPVSINPVIVPMDPVIVPMDRNFNFIPTTPKAPAISDLLLDKTTLSTPTLPKLTLLKRLHSPEESSATTVKNVNTQPTSKKTQRKNKKSNNKIFCPLTSIQEEVSPQESTVIIQ